MALNINGTTGISGVDGSASAPALQGSDSNTGVSFGTDTVNINTGGATKVIVDSSGNVGIGEVSPIGKLHVSTADSGATAEVSADELVVEGEAHSGISVLSGTGSAGSLNFGDSGDNDIGRVIYHHATNHMQFNASGSEIMRLTIANAQIGTLSTSGASLGFNFDLANGHGQQISTNNTGFRYQMRFYNPNGQVGYISTNGSATAFITSSDYRLKENEAAISDGITRLKQLKPYKFNFKTDSSTILDGFFAHEVSSIVPEAITGTKDAVVTQAMIDAGDFVEGTLNDPIYQGIDQSKLVPLLTAALQEAVAKIEVLETKVAALEAG